MDAELFPAMRRSISTVVLTHLTFPVVGLVIVPAAASSNGSTG